MENPQQIPLAAAATTTNPPVKNRAPQYPRPVSPVSADEIPLSKNTIIYAESSFWRTRSPEPDGEKNIILQNGKRSRIQDQGKAVRDVETETGRAAKRRRIEAFAASYLRGESVFILSAGLKGNFGSTWKNPWKKPSVEIKCTEEEMLPNQQEIPETSRRIKNHVVKQQLNPGHIARQNTDVDEVKTNVVQRKLKEDEKKAVVDRVFENPIPIPARRTDDVVGVQGNLDQDAVVQTTEKRVKDRRVEDWLKRSDAYGHISSGEPMSSPTPLISRQIDFDKDPHRQPPLSSPLKQHKPNHSGLHELSNRAVADSPAHFSGLDMIERQEPAQTILSGDDFETAPASPSKIEDSMEGPKSPQKRSRDEVVEAAEARGEQAKKRFRRRSLHTASPSANLPAFEYRRVNSGEQGRQPPEKERSKDGEKTKPQTLVNQQTDESVRDKIASDGSKSGHTDKQILMQPQLSTETSKGSTVNHLPSAQVQQPVPLPQSLTNHINNESMLQEVEENVFQNDKAVAEMLAPPFPTAIAEPENALTSTSKEMDRATGATDNQKTPTAPTNSDAQDLDTQQMIAAISPLAFSTVKKPVSKIPATKTPVTATKTVKRSKKTSFAGEKSGSDTSQGSIKAGLKLSKPNNYPSSKKEAEKSMFIDTIHPQILEEQTNTNKHTNNDETSNPSSPNSSTSLHQTPNHPPPAGQSAKPPRSILKSSTPHSSKPYTMPSGKHDAQLEIHQVPSGQNELLMPEPFNLEEAMDEIHEFLDSPWDVELEGSGVLTSFAQ